MRKSLAAALVLTVVTGTVAAAAALHPGLSFTLQLIQTLSRRADVLQARLDAKDAPTSARAAIDVAQAVDGTGAQTFIAGWAFACESEALMTANSAKRTVVHHTRASRAVVVVDDIELDDVPTFNPYRIDVQGAYEGAHHCQQFGGGYVPYDSGVEFSVDLSRFGAGEHRVQIRVYDLAGRVYTSTESAFVTIAEP